MGAAEPPRATSRVEPWYVCIMLDPYARRHRRPLPTLAGMIVAALVGGGLASRARADAPEVRSTTREQNAELPMTGRNYR